MVFETLLFLAVIAIRTIAVISSLYDVSLSCIQSPIRIKAVKEVFAVRPLPPFADQKTFGSRPCPLGVSGLVVVNQPLVGSRRGQ
jgi:hypothetical protein